MAEWIPPSHDDLERAFHDAIHHTRSRAEVASWAIGHLDRDNRAGGELHESVTDALDSLAVVDGPQLDAEGNRVGYMFTAVQIAEWRDEYRASLVVEPDDVPGGRLGGVRLVAASSVWFVGAVMLLAVSDAAELGTVAFFAYPAVGAGVALLLRGRRWPRIVTVVASLPVLMLVFSIGPLYLPGIVLMLIAASVPGCQNSQSTGFAKARRT